jgi:GTP cyclohydrolase III
MFLGGDNMLQTIAIGTTVYVQGIFVRTLPSGKVQVRVGDQTFSGAPVQNVA